MTYDIVIAKFLSLFPAGVCEHSSVPRRRGPAPDAPPGRVPGRRARAPLARLHRQGQAARGRRHHPEAPGTNCINMGLPGKQILR